MMPANEHDGPPAGFPAFAIEPGEIRTQLERVLSSPEFHASKRNHEFLRYVVEETLAGREHYIKGYSIAQSVFNRDASFDPQLDPVVRIEASRLRRHLERYYLTAGREDPVRIDLPKGSYVPTFEHRAPSSGPDGDEQTTARKDERSPVAIADQTVPSIIILPFRDISSSNDAKHLASGITEELVCALTQFRTMRVIGNHTSFGLPASSEPVEVGRSLSIDFVLQGSVRVHAGRIRVTGQLLRVADEICVWSQSFDRDLQPDSAIEIETDVARAIAATLGAPYGTLSHFSRNPNGRAVPASLVAYECLLRWYAYRRIFSQELHEEVRTCLEKTTEAAPDYAESWAALAYVYLDEHRFGLAGIPDRTSLLDKALAAAQRAVALDCYSCLAHLALSIVHFYRHDLERASEQARRALELNPYNPEVMVQVGWRMAIPGDWEGGMRLVREGLQLDPDPPKWCRLILAVDAYRRGDGLAALNEIRNGAITQIPVAFVVGVAILAEFGELGEARALSATAREIYPCLFDDPGSQLTLHNLETALAGRFLASLSRVGMRTGVDAQSGPRKARRRRPELLSLSLGGARTT